MTAPAKSGGFNINIGEIRKFITAVAGLAAIAITQGLISGTAAKWVAIGLGVATAAGVYVVPNDPPGGAVDLPPTPPAPPTTTVTAPTANATITVQPKGAPAPPTPPGAA